MVAMKTKIRFRKAKVKKSQKKWNLRKLAQMEKEFNKEVDIGLQQMDSTTLQDRWVRLRDSITNGAEKTIGYEEVKKAKSHGLRRTWSSK